MRLLPRAIVIILISCLAFPVVHTQSVWAEEEITADTPMPDIAAYQEKVDEATANYDDATQRIKKLQAEIKTLESHIKEIEDDLPQAREISNNAARDYYRALSTSSPFLEMILGATSLADFFAKVEYSARINQGYLDEISSLSRLNDSLEQSLEELNSKLTSLEEEQRIAEEALLDAESARASAEATAQKISELTAAATAEVAAAVAAEEHVQEETVKPSVTETVSYSDKQSFVNEWAPRIDAYLAGSPMAGYGYAFANAAYDYNVDPRWSPAIAYLESSLGRYCYRPYNAWGWGGISWPDWETAIYTHVRGLSVGYGYTISETAAQKYCPPNWEHWYSVVSQQMARI